jgi:PAS domain S-box-containing protein
MGEALLFDNFRNKIIEHAWNRERVCGRPVFFRILAPVALAFIVTYIITGPVSFVERYAPFLAYFGVIFFSACYGGSRSALVASISSTVCTIVFLYPGHQQNGANTFAILIVFFLLEALMIVALFAVIELIQERYRLSEETYRGIVEKNAEGFLMADEDGIINYVCSSVTEILGYDREELLGAQLQALVHPDELSSFNLKFLKILAKGGHSMSFLQRLETRDGEWKWIEGCVNNMLKNPGIKRIVFNYRNVTDRVNKTKQQEDFIHMAAHELKTPITALRGYLQLIELNHRKEQRDKDKDMLERMNRQTDRLLNLIDEMLNVTRIRAGELQYHFNQFDLYECVQDVVDSLQAVTKTHKLTLQMGYCSHIYGDRDRIGQVLANLISNAIKYSPNSPDVAIKVASDEDGVMLRVKDHGIGIPQEQQKKIFERFYRSETLPKNTYEGLGLGLYIAMDIVKKHKGKIGVESEVGKGSEFWFSFPAKAGK